ncbi:guanylate cyclase activator 2B-like [Archocentrus centrarchus]|uniref:guanylate cyclase activator 2B-like n=1 Tax=Archocentrus centrarchus TaxID=63155 RepID=UPI0011EA1DB8|nr:guanylate cyclase activator 2B-like [Archocentrus centrarchus]
MRVFVALVLAVCVCSGALGVWIRAGDRRLPLEACEAAQKNRSLDDNVGRHLDTNTVRAVCANPLLPQVFRPVCQRDEAGAVSQFLVATDMNECEICANPACTGCMY